MLLLLVTEAELDGVVAVGLFRLHLENGAGTCLNDGYRDRVALAVEDLGHAQLATENGLPHDRFLLVLSYPSPSTGSGPWASTGPVPWHQCQGKDVLVGEHGCVYEIRIDVKQGKDLTSP